MKKILLTAVAMLLGVQASVAKVPESEAQALKAGPLTPMGAEKKGNSKGTVPAWEGGIKTGPSAWGGNGKRLVDPYAIEKPLFTITVENLASYRANLTPGQLGLFTRYPKSYRLPVYPSHRSLAQASYIYNATYQNALHATLADGSDALQNAAMGIPFPVPKTGAEVIWNHKLRHTGVKFRRSNSQLVVSETGAFTETRLREDVYSAYLENGMTPEKLEKTMAVYFLQLVKAPARLAGTVNLGLSPMDQGKQPQMVWQYNPGQKRTRRAPAVAYDAPDPGTDGLTFVDQVDIFNGALDRYTWKLVGKKEFYVPYNSYQLGSDQHKYKDIVQAGHLNPAHTRYELHRAWVVEASLKAGTRHAYSKRVFYVDEDSWQIVLADLYDARGALWRAQEAHTALFYRPEDPHVISTAETSYDLLSGRYVVATVSNEGDAFKETPELKVQNFDLASMEKLR